MSVKLYDLAAPSLFTLVGCVVSTYVGAFVFKYTGLSGQYQRFQFHRFAPRLRFVLGMSAWDVLNRRTVLVPLLEIGTAFFLSYWATTYGFFSASMARYVVGG